MADIPNNAPESCPGTESASAGKTTACQGCPNQSICSSGQTKLPDPGIQEVRWRLASVKHIIVVLSGKGGVGKSTFTSTFARGLALDEKKQVAVLDVDICGPSIPGIFGVQDEQVHQSGSGWSPVFVEDNLSVMSIGFLLQSVDEAVIWRGPRKNGIIKQFLKDVDWGDIDYLIIDTPPGTSDEHLSLVQYLSQANIDGAVIITTPQEVSILDVRKEINFCSKVKLPILGVVENMSGFVCPKCQTESQIFPPTTGGGEALANELGLQFLGRLPLDPRIDLVTLPDYPAMVKLKVEEKSQCCDEGKSFLNQYPESPAAQAYHQVIKKVIDQCDKS